MCLRMGCPGCDTWVLVDGSGRETAGPGKCHFVGNGKGITAAPTPLGDNDPAVDGLSVT